jgi:hypothetical protein
LHPAQLESDPPLVVYLGGALLKSDLLPRQRKARRRAHRPGGGMSSSGRAKPFGAGTARAVRRFFALGMRRAKGTVRTMFGAASA